MSKVGRNEISVLFFLFWVKQERQNKDILASNRKVAGKQISWLNDVIVISQPLHMTSLNLEYNKKIAKLFSKIKI